MSKPVKAIIQEQSFKRLVIDIDPIIYVNASRNTIIFNHADVSIAVSNVVRAWVQRATDPDYKLKGNYFYLPDLILEHASEWGLQ